MYNALIRTHHITSRKKVAALKAAAKKLNCYALLRSGGVPGVMYCEAASLEPVQKWVEIVHSLRYKDYRLVVPACAAVDHALLSTKSLGSLEEVDSVKAMAALMDSKGLTAWWRAGMGFA